MSELNKEDPLNELVKNGMQMVGPYEELHKEKFIQYESYYFIIRVFVRIIHGKP